MEDAHVPRTCCSYTFYGRNRRTAVRFNRPHTPVPASATNTASLAATMEPMTDKPSIQQERQEEVQEIFDVLRHWHPDRSTFDLWNEALSLYRVRFETEVLPPDPRR